MKNKKTLYGLICLVVIGCIILAIGIVLFFNKKVDLSKMLNYDSYKLSVHKLSDVGCIEFGQKEYDYYYIVDYKNNIEYFEDNTYDDLPTKLYNTSDGQITWAKNKNDEIVWYRVSNGDIVEYNNYRKEIQNIVKTIVESKLKKVDTKENFAMYKIDTTEELIANFNIVVDSDFELQDVLETIVVVNKENTINSIKLSIQEKNEDEGYADNCYDYELVFSDFNNVTIDIPDNIISNNGLVGTYLSSITCSDGRSYDEKIVLTNSLKRFVGKGTLLGDMNKIRLMDCQKNQIISSSNVDYKVESNTLIISTTSEEYQFEIKDNTLIKKDSQEIFSREK